MVKRRGYSRKERTTPLAEYLTSLRVNRGLTQEEIAKKIGKSRSCICKIERGHRERQCLHGIILYQLADAYGAPIEKVLEMANWPQLLLLGTNEEQKQRIIRYLQEQL